MVKNIAMAAVLFLVMGCSAVKQRVVGLISGDLDIAIARGEKALGANDPLVVCYKALDKVIKAQQTTDELNNGLLLDLAMRARIIDQTRKLVAKDLQGACSEIAMEIMIQAGSRGIVR